MSNRPTHNRIAKMIVPDVPISAIDRVNQDVDRKDMLKKYGKNHRKFWGHDLNANAPDSLAITKGDPKLEKVRKVHILVDTDPKIKRMVKRMEIKEQIKKMGVK